MIIETDLGNDPDDLFAILWLLAVDVKIEAPLECGWDICRISKRGWQ